MIDFVQDQYSSVIVRDAASAAALALMNASAALARAKSKKMSNGKIDREAVKAAKIALAAAQSVFDDLAGNLAQAYDCAMIPVRNHVHGVDVMIPRYNRGSVCDPSMDAYHQM
jgi:hypothetical protein